MYFYSQISCKAIGKVLYNSTFKGRENEPVRFHESVFQTDPESFSFLSWKTKKVLFIKKNLGYCQHQNKNALFTDPIFSEGFGRVILLYCFNYLYLHF